MNKNYIAPQVEVAKIGSQSMICASGESAPATGGSIPVIGTIQTTEKVW